MRGVVFESTIPPLLRNMADTIKLNMFRTENFMSCAVHKSVM